MWLFMKHSDKLILFKRHVQKVGAEVYDKASFKRRAQTCENNAR